MTKLPDDDQNLVKFLRQNRPEVPPSSPDLEEKLFQAIKSNSPSPLQHHFPRTPVRSRQRWLVPSAIAASLALIWAGNYWRESNPLSNSFATTNSTSQTVSNSLNKTNISSQDFLITHHNRQFWGNNNSSHQELHNIENFLENNWTGVVSNHHSEISVETIQDEYLNLAEAKSYQSTKTPPLVTTRR
jgi:hypothetical protein